MESRVNFVSYRQFYVYVTFEYAKLDINISVH